MGNIYEAEESGWTQTKGNKRKLVYVRVFFFFFTLIFKQKTGSRQEENSIARWVLK